MFVKRMIDVHSHVLFKMDDGSTDLQMSKEMLLAMVEQGVTDVFCTSHSWGHFDKYQNNLNILRQESIDIPIKIHVGCEIESYTTSELDEIIGDLLAGKIPTMSESNYILLEFQPQDTIECIFSAIKKFKERTQYDIIIAHLERYRILNENREYVTRLEEMGCLFQINAHSLVDEVKVDTKEFARWLIDKQLVTFIGSDSHRMNHRPPNVTSGVEYIYSHCPKEYADGICYRNAENFLLMNSQGEENNVSKFL